MYYFLLEKTAICFLFLIAFKTLVRILYMA